MEFDYRTGDCRELLKTVPDASVRLVVTSPPYNIGKSYGKYKDKIALNDWQDLINDTTKEVCRILTPDGAFFLNLSPVPIGSSKEIIPLPFLGYQIFKDNGLYLRNMITWTFNNMQNCTNRLSGRYENILWGVKDIDNYIFNLDDVRIPYLTKGDKRLAEGGGRNPTDVWYFDRVNNMTKKKLNLSHPTVYPLSMIVRIVKMATNPGDTVLDPFAGSGTSLVAAKIMGRNGIGFELDEKYREECMRRLETEGTMPAYEVDDLTDKILKMSEGMEDAFCGIQDILKPFHAAGDEFSFEEIGSRLTGLFILTSKEYDLQTEMAICQIVSGINHCWTESHQIRLYLNGAKRIGRALKESKLPFILMDRSVVPVRKIYGEIFLYNISIQVACRGYDYETAGYFALRVGVDRERRRKVLRRMGVGKGAVTDGPMPMLMKKDDFLNLPEDECIIVTFRLPAIKDKKICTEKQI